MTVEFEEKQTLGGGWSIEVRSNHVLLGHIRRRPDTGAFRYYRGAHNDLTATYESDSVEEVKRQVAANP